MEKSNKVVITFDMDAGTFTSDMKVDRDVPLQEIIGMMMIYFVKLIMRMEYEHGTFN